ncbi:MAG: ECF transporter S component [Clostridia bacterium]
MPQLNRKALVSTQNLTVISILAAISAVLYMVEIPVVLFYKLDFSNLPVLLGTFAMGPFAGMLVLLVKDLLGLLHSSSQGVGEIADFLTALAMIIPAGLIYQKDKSRNSAVLGMAVGAIAASLVGVFSNVYLLVPFYGVVYGMPVAQIVSMGQALVPAVDSLWKFVFMITAPFNLLKWIALSVMGALMYKPLSPILHGHTRRAAGGKKS